MENNIFGTCINIIKQKIRLLTEDKKIQINSFSCFKNIEIKVISVIDFTTFNCHNTCLIGVYGLLI